MRAIMWGDDELDCSARRGDGYMLVSLHGSWADQDFGTGRDLVLPARPPKSLTD